MNSTMSKIGEEYSLMIDWKYSDGKTGRVCAGHYHPDRGGIVTDFWGGPQRRQKTFRGWQGALKRAGYRWEEKA